MFDLGWSELLLIAVVAIVVVGPRDLPRMMRTVGQYASKARGMARDMQSQFNDAVRDADLEDVGRQIQDLKSMNPGRQLRDTLTKPLQSAGEDIEKTASSIDEAVKAENEPAPAPDTPAVSQDPEPAPVPAPEAAPAPAPEPVADIADNANAGAGRAASGS